MNDLRAVHGTALTWSMARRRNAARYRPLWLVAAGLLLTGMLAGGIQLGNAITTLRREVQDLARLCDNEEAQRAMLSVRWNTASSRQVVMRRAQRELELVCPDAPGTILVATRGDAAANPIVAQFLRRLDAPRDPLPGAIAGTVVR